MKKKNVGKGGRDPECGIDCLKDAGKTLFLVCQNASQGIPEVHA